MIKIEIYICKGEMCDLLVWCLSLSHDTNNYKYIIEKRKKGTQEFW